MDASPTHRERLWPGPLGWVAVVGFAVFGLVALLPVDGTAAVVGGAATLAAGVAVAVVTSPTVAVTGGELRAGRAHIPLGLLGRPEVLDADGVRGALGPGSDARTFAVLRTWTRGAVLVPVLDPADPTPAWLVSSRRPAALAAAVEAGRGAQAAHSEQIG